MKINQCRWSSVQVISYVYSVTHLASDWGPPLYIEIKASYKVMSYNIPQ